MSIAATFAIGVAVAIAVLVGLALVYGGSGSDLLDWDPSERMARRQEAEDEDLDVMLARHNAQRARDGLPPESEDDMRREIAQRRRRDR